MTANHFQIIAKAFKTAKEDATLSTDLSGILIAQVAIEEALTEAFPLFNLDRFRQAAKIESLAR